MRSLRDQEERPIMAAVATMRDNFEFASSIPNYRTPKFTRTLQLILKAPPRIRNFGEMQKAE
jgi:hypothetical protein